MRVVRLEEIAELTPGYVPQQAAARRAGRQAEVTAVSGPVEVPLVAIGEIDDHGFIRRGLAIREVPPATAAALACALGDVLVSWRGTIGRIGLVDAECVGAVPSGNLVRVRPRAGGVTVRVLPEGNRGEAQPTIEPEVLFAFIQCARGRIDALAIGKTIRWLRLRDLGALEIRLPPPDDIRRLRDLVRATRIYVSSGSAALERRWAAAMAHAASTVGERFPVPEASPVGQERPDRRRAEASAQPARSDVPDALTSAVQPLLPLVGEAPDARRGLLLAVLACAVLKRRLPQASSAGPGRHPSGRRAWPDASASEEDRLRFLREAWPSAAQIDAIRQATGWIKWDENGGPLGFGGHRVMAAIVGALGSIPIEEWTDLAALQAGRRLIEAIRPADTWYTPAKVCDLIARVANPQGGDRILDPSCGGGEFLAACFEHLLERTGQACDVVACDPDPWRRACTVLLLGLVEGGKVTVVDKLEAAAGQFDVIVCNPTYRDRGSRDEGHSPFRHRAELEFVGAAMRFLSRSGRLALITSPGIATRGGADRQIRKQLLEEDQLEAVVELPSVARQRQLLVLLKRAKKSRAEGRVVLVGESAFDDAPDAVEKVAALIERSDEQPGRSRVLATRDLLAADARWEVQRRADRKPTPEARGSVLRAVATDLKELEERREAARADMDRILFPES